MEFNFTHPTTIFSSDGVLKHCDRALTCGLKGLLSVGINAVDGCVIGTVKTDNVLIDKSEVFKIYRFNKHIGMTYSGLQPDYRIICNKMSKIVEGYEQKYGNMYVEMFVDRLGREMQEYTIKSNYRPLGLLLLVCGVSCTGQSKLYSLDPSGSFQELKCAAVGVNYADALKYLKRRRENLEDNMCTVMGGLKEFGNGDEVQMAVIRNGEFEVLKDEEVREIYESMDS